MMMRYGEYNMIQGWTLDVDAHSTQGGVDNTNILSTILIHNGRVVWQHFDKEWTFASDADQMDEELNLLIPQLSSQY